MPYQTQLKEKTDRLTALLTPFAAPELQVFPSAEQGYRMRAEFRVWHEGDEISYAMFQAGSKASSASLIKMPQFPAAHESINALMPVLLKKVSGCTVLKTRFYQCEFLATLSGEMLVSMIYHKKLDDEWIAAARALQDELGIHIIGRSRGQKIVLSQDYVTEKLNVHGETFQYRQLEGGFTQPNAKVCEKMLEWACDQAQGATDDLLELYCGNGNFTLPLSRRFNRVLATEVSKTSVAAAQWNIQANQADNIVIARLSAEEFSAAFSGSRNFQRLAQNGVVLADYDFSTIFIDPPRAGVDDETLKLVAQFDRVIYVSCNPETLCSNLLALTKTHTVQAAALFDQFPFTHHIESGVLLVKKAA
ncbi:tRNA (uridine(54)-C5)-methyltransferase TrmA [Kingella negevensis]|uniref:tRNA (uridine(54)-C5)-methyltransferase TrmA n=1 Tax=Kingella negevensis TaxID=1522312 RepID=UPI00254BEC8B|nr:tRNA (uridine(54)-C5)-methyltransferase TrmA [Kingella negevensis]MDK4680635.1 tRNA (uridine(54)-C5)-methyltransferase TrmA [Kingella negevensis]MDK4681642.1 tRNA (uridine(54)-C5)-methyltransferase TrmA [Kingella negevensis]MDK4683725.1 tRNA (uridine(54)-C5)-methyltransferase TrmA [Kingella negevensis]MDK4689840.1 tRNA (uridine(54)-C5)-methyltransferase TrmA [Kingella negevensis]MDK4692816.1 tRNA (uridine(54)-C5)-methyltransferase TrmA [Kingella negevensis]